MLLLVVPFSGGLHFFARNIPKLGNRISVLRAAWRELAPQDVFGVGMFDVAPAPQEMKLFGFNDVEADDPEPRTSICKEERQANVAKSKDADRCSFRKYHGVEGGGEGKTGGRRAVFSLLASCALLPFTFPQSA